MNSGIGLICLKLPFSCPAHRAGVRMRARLPGIVFFNTQHKRKGGRRRRKSKWEGERGTWPDFQSCRINVHLGESCASAEPLPRGYLKIGCGGPTSHPHPCNIHIFFFFSTLRCLVKATPNPRRRSSDGLAPHRLPPEPPPPRASARASPGGWQHPGGGIIFPSPLSASHLMASSQRRGREMLSGSQGPLCQMEADSLTGSQEG